MKKVTVFAALIAVVLFTGSAYAQDDVKVSAGVKAGWQFLQDEPFDNAVENNWLVGGDLIVWLPSNFGFGADVKFSTKDSENADIDEYDMDFEWTQVPLNLNAYYRIVTDDSEFTPYISGGFSMVWTDLTVTDYSGVLSSELSVDEWAYGFNVLGGVQYGMFFVEGQYIWAEADFDDLAFLKEDVDDSLNVGGFNIAAGIRF